ncbi:MAG: hypothetical protein Q8P57_00315 [Candidatus Pacearchaeota archaeon]|nr:hypothetical protein [Candidatus Pacearchaeota archaeon]
MDEGYTRTSSRGKSKSLLSKIMHTADMLFVPSSLLRYHNSSDQESRNSSGELDYSEAGMLMRNSSLAGALVVEATRLVLYATAFYHFLQ